MYKEVIRTHLSQQTWAVRCTLGWSQEKMSEQLRITSRAYGDLERGRYCFSSVTLLLLLRLMGKEESWNLVTRVCTKMVLSEQ